MGAPSVTTIFRQIDRVFRGRLGVLLAQYYGSRMRPLLHFASRISTDRPAVLHDHGVKKPDILELTTDDARTWLPYYVNPHTNEPGVRLSRILPSGYESYLRLFHPLALSDDGVTREPRTWRSVAEQQGLVFHAELQWDNLRPRMEETAHGVPVEFFAFLGGSADGEPRGRSGVWSPDPLGTSPEQDSGRRWPIEGTLGEPARSRLFGRLSEATGNQRVFFYYGIGAMGVTGKDWLFEATADELKAVQQLANAKVEPKPFPVPGPEYVWPADRSWIVITDYDLVSTYIACDANLAALLLRTDDLELLPVTIETRIDSRADTVNGQRSAE